MELHELTLRQAREKLDKKEVSSVELTKAMLERVEATEPALHAYLTLTPEKALEQARAADDMIAAGQAGPLTGIPAGIKDVICTEGVRSTCGSKILENFVPTFDAYLSGAGFARGRAGDAGQAQHGRVRHGKLHREHSAFGPTNNPWDLDGFDPRRLLGRLGGQRGGPLMPVSRWAPTPAAPSASRPPTAGWWA